MKTHTVILALTFFFMTLAVTAQRAGIHGQVVCGRSGDPIEYATVAVADSAGHLVNGAVTDATGNYAIRGLAPGIYLLEVSFIGYEKQKTPTVEIHDKKELLVIPPIRLIPVSKTLEEVSVTGELRGVEHKVDRQVVNVAKQSNAAGGTLADVLQNIPSVRVDAEGNVTLRGSTDFTLFIDGKPSVLRGSESLKSIPAETVEKVEVITNPSARYDAAGVSGILNVITKKKQMKGTDALISASAATGDKYTGALKISNRGKRMTGYAEANYAGKWQHTSSRSDRTITSGEIPVKESVSDTRQLYRLDAQGKIGADIPVAGKNSLSFFVQGGSWQFSRGIGALFTTSLQNNPAETEIITREDFKVTNNFIGGDLCYTHQFGKNKEHTLTVDLFDSYIESTSPDTYTEPELGGMQQIDNQSFRNNFRFKADYTLPVDQKNKLEAGLQADLQKSYYLYDYRVMIIDSGWIRNDSLSGTMDYHRDILAAYAVWSGQWLGIDYQAGLRAEQTLQEIAYSAEAGTNRFGYFNLFPSLHLSKDFGETHQVSLSYSRRINRPTEWQLSPLLYSSDRFYLRRGNPGLQPEYIDAIELGYNLQLKKFDLHTEGYARKSRNSINSVILEERGLFYETYENLEQGFNAGTNLQVIWKPWRWLKLDLGSSLSYSWWEGVLSNGEALKNQTPDLNCTFRPVFVITPITDLTFQAIWYAPSRNVQGLTSSFYYFDFIFRQQFLKKRLVLTVRTHNTFDTGLYRYTASGDGFSSESWYRYEGPVVIAGLSWKINNLKPRAARHEVKMDFDSGLDH